MFEQQQEEAIRGCMVELDRRISSAISRMRLARRSATGTPVDDSFSPTTTATAANAHLGSSTMDHPTVVTGPCSFIFLLPFLDQRVRYYGCIRVCVCVCICVV